MTEEILTWPATLDFSQNVLLDNSEKWSSSKIETDMESGPPHARAVDSINFSIWDCQIYLRTNEQRLMFKKFWQSDTKNGVKPFRWVDPITGMSMKFMLVSVNSLSSVGAGRHFAHFTIRQVPE